ncbi:ankyrin repeat domain-containing protein [Candidatus Dependentiae bacterium]|nr:ankyrin repeat domain-containing protein [Candidatus Dependentiae bacterium]
MAIRFTKTTLLCLLSIIIIWSKLESTHKNPIEKKSFLSKLGSLWSWSSKKNAINYADSALDDTALNNAFGHLRKLMKNERVKMVKKYIRKIPSLVNKSDRNGITPLHIATYYEDAHLVKFLLKQGAAPDLRTNDGFTPLHIAVYKGHFDIIDQLLATKEVDIDGATTEDQYTPLHIAVRFSKANHILNELIETGANINKQSRLGRTPLHLAVIRGDIGSLKMLLKKGALVNTFSKKSDSDIGGKTPLDDAIDHGCFEIIKLLKSYGAQPGVNKTETPNGSLHQTKRYAGYQLAQAADYLARAAMR